MTCSGELYSLTFKLSHYAISEQAIQAIYLMLAVGNDYLHIWSEIRGLTSCWWRKCQAHLTSTYILNSLVVVRLHRTSTHSNDFRFRFARRRRRMTETWRHRRHFLSPQLMRPGRGIQWCWEWCAGIQLSAATTDRPTYRLPFGRHCAPWSWIISH